MLLKIKLTCEQQSAGVNMYYIFKNGHVKNKNVGMKTKLLFKHLFDVACTWDVVGRYTSNFANIYFWYR